MGWCAARDGVPSRRATNEFLFQDAGILLLDGMSAGMVLNVDLKAIESFQKPPSSGLTDVDNPLDGHGDEHGGSKMAKLPLEFRFANSASVAWNPKVFAMRGFPLHHVWGKGAKGPGTRHIQLDCAALISRSNSVFFKRSSEAQKARKSGCCEGFSHLPRKLSNSFSRRS